MEWVRRKRCDAFEKYEVRKKVAWHGERSRMIHKREGEMMPEHNARGVYK